MEAGTKQNEPIRRPNRSDDHPNMQAASRRSRRPTSRANKVRRSSQRRAPQTSSNMVRWVADSEERNELGHYQLRLVLPAVTAVNQKWCLVGFRSGKRYPLRTPPIVPQPSDQHQRASSLYPSVQSSRFYCFSTSTTAPLHLLETQLLSNCFADFLYLLCHLERVPSYFFFLPFISFFPFYFLGKKS